MNHKCYNAHTGLNVYRQDTFMATRVRFPTHAAADRKLLHPELKNKKDYFCHRLLGWHLAMVDYLYMPLLHPQRFIGQLILSLRSTVPYLIVHLGTLTEKGKNVSQLSIIELLAHCLWSAASG